MKDFLFGVDYYPEHWSRERWTTDAEMMRDMGLDTVRMAEFSWSCLEPEEGHYCFDWLEEVIGILGSKGIRTILGTPTAAPPAWLIQKYPSIEPVDRDGCRRHFGGRHHDCQSDPAYRRHIRRFVTAFADRFGRNPDVIGWQIDNELGNSHDDLCCCESCGKQFREWLQSKYGDIATLNQCWGTAFWSQGYQSFDQIMPPLRTVTGSNPSRELDWKRFCADLVLEFHDMQAEIIRAKSPGRFITHNMMGFCDKYRYNEHAKELEFVSQDQYPCLYFSRDMNAPKAAESAAPLDFMRSLRDAPFCVMEQQSAVTGWETMSRAPRPGQLALWSMQSIAHGADAVVYFRWRSCTMGHEQYWHGLLPHSGIPKRNFDELSRFIRDMKPLLADMQGAMPPRQVGILYSYDQNWAIRIQPQHPELNYQEHLMTWYRAFHEKQIPVDFTWTDRSWQPYTVLIAPLWYLTDPEINDRFRRYVKQGGTLVLDMRCGIKDMNNLCLTDKLPAGLTDLTGVEIDEYDCLRDTENTVIWNGNEYPCAKWCDIMHTETAKVVGVWGREFYSITPAVTKNRYGSGIVWYVGTEMSPELAHKMATTLIRENELQSLGQAAPDVEMTLRRGKDREWLFILNHAGEQKPLPDVTGWQCVYGPEDAVMQGYECRVYERKTENRPSR